MSRKDRKKVARLENLNYRNICLYKTVPKKRVEDHFFKK